MHCRIDGEPHTGPHCSLFFKSAGLCCLEPYLLNTWGTYLGSPSLRVKREIPEKSDRTQTEPVARNGYSFG
jgi:hypothetical protein